MPRRRNRPSLLDKLKRLIREPEPFDPSRFDDPIASKTEWTPIKKGGSNFKTHKLVEQGGQQLAFVASVGLKLFCLLFVLMGTGISGFVIYKALESGKSVSSFDVILPAVIGLAFAAIGTTMLIFGLKPRVFDRTHGYYWKGFKGPSGIYNPDEFAKFTQLHQIHAIQLIKERCRTKNGSYYSYELNLVFEDASRVNVIDHGSLNAIVADAGKLAEFLQVPVWNAT